MLNLYECTVTEKEYLHLSTINIRIREKKNALLLFFLKHLKIWEL